MPDDDRAGKEVGLSLFLTVFLIVFALYIFLDVTGVLQALFG